MGNRTQTDGKTERKGRRKEERNLGREEEEACMNIMICVWMCARSLVLEVCKMKKKEESKKKKTRIAVYRYR